MASTIPTLRDDLCLPFQIEGVDVRGQIVKLGSVVDEVLTKHEYPHEVSVLIGEMLALATMLGTALKFEGRISLQTKSDGPVSMAVADFFSPDTVRAYARFDESALKGALEKIEGDRPSVAELCGKGHFALIIDQGSDTEQYQGIVPLEGDTISECAQIYFQQSEQLATSVKTAVSKIMSGQDDGADEKWRAGALMIQHTPKPKEQRAPEEEAPSEIWNRVNILLSTVEDHELLDPTLPPEEVLYRLYHEDGVRVYEAHDLKAGCSCDEGRVTTMLQGFSDTERADMAKAGKIEVRCEFCNHLYVVEEAKL